MCDDIDPIFLCSVCGGEIEGYSVCYECEYADNSYHKNGRLGQSFVVDDIKPGKAEAKS